MLFLQDKKNNKEVQYLRLSLFILKGNKMSWTKCDECKHRGEIIYCWGCSWNEANDTYTESEKNDYFEGESNVAKEEIQRITRDE